MKKQTKLQCEIQELEKKIFNKRYSFPDHTGRPGQVGGSLPREGGESKPSSAIKGGGSLPLKVGNSDAFRKGYDDGKYGFTYIPDNYSEKDLLDWVKGLSAAKEELRNREESKKRQQ